MVIERQIPLNVIRPQSPYTGTITKSELLTQNGSPNYCRHIEIDITGSPLENNFEVGQSFGVIPEWNYREHDTTLRLYSIASPKTGEDGSGSTIATSVKRIIEESNGAHQLFLGTASNYLCDLQVGDPVQVTGPTGKRMLLPDDISNHNFVLIATGTGIAPFRGMIIELLEGEFDNEVHLIFGVPYRTDIYYEALFRRYEAKYPNFHFYTALSREEVTHSGTRMYVHDRMAVEWNRLGPILEQENTLLYLCGLKGMEFGVKQLLIQNRLYGFFRTVPEELRATEPPSIYNLDEVIDRLRPNTNRMRVEVY